MFQKISAGGAIEVSDRAPEEKYQQMLIVLAAGRHLRQAIQILALEADDADRIDIAEFTLAHGQSGRRNFDGMIRGVLTPSERLQQPASLLSAAAAKLRDHQRQRQTLHDVIRVAI